MGNLKVEKSHSNGFKVQITDDTEEIIARAWVPGKPETMKEAKLKIPKPLVEKIEGPFTEDGRQVEEMIVGKSYIFKATQFSKSVHDPFRHIKWSVEQDEKGTREELPSSELYKEDNTICYKYTPSQGEKVRIYAFCQSASKDISIEVPLVSFPFCIDRYKMPGLDRDGEDIAHDLTYGKGAVSSNHTSVYPPDEVKKYRKEYIVNGFDIEKHGVFANMDTIRENPYDSSIGYRPSQVGSDHFNEYNARRDEHFNNKALYISNEYDRASYPKAIYSQEEIYQAEVPWIIDSGKDVKAYHEGSLFIRDTSDKNLFKLFEEYATTCFAIGAMEGNIKRMIAKFQANEGGIYEDEVLTNQIANHSATKKYCEHLQDYIAEKLKESQGKLLPIIDNIPDFEWQDRDKKGKITVKKNEEGDYIRFARPTFGSLTDTIRGETIALNDIWATEVMIEDIDFRGEDYTVKYQVTLWDHFGLDMTDIEALPNTIPYAKETFAVWFALQHLRGYKPFITKMSFQNTFRGNLKEGMFEREQNRKEEKDSELDAKIEQITSPFYTHPGKI
ncbi:DUF3289 family protein [Rapidithrix thailandica]|uniref:DUF3289 family protein n=1 Tax=Rapidithrix thailandica TaxID=413964 RepID=A0AAW9SAJ4_9BACT